MEIATKAGIKLLSADMITTNATVSGLTAGTGYNVVLVAVSGDQSSNALHESFYTSKYMMILSTTIDCLISK